MTDQQGTFLVTHADGESAVVTDVETGQVHTLADHPDLAVGEAFEATLAPEPPMEVTWEIRDMTGRRSIPVERSSETPTRRSREVAAQQEVGEITTLERAGEGEIHVLTVPEEGTDDAARDVLDDEATLQRAARLGVTRVEVRTAEGVVSVRYLPD
jgi:hypothetical protein